ncbi:hypothetical protein BIY23_03635 [Wolbachia pipientis]|uniref:Tetratricopeptide repeat protein n=1 Tax=Wolbachia pipientis TaxID=955 RepID=A0A1E7QJ38_WOLPI|nr:hypothetical protein [Wolbachia pipientis]OEY86492.1 hypothetical protein BIY23_03635 [Wolbachia pipientis]
MWFLVSEKQMQDQPGTSEQSKVQSGSKALLPHGNIEVDTTTEPEVKVEVFSPSSDRIYDIAWMEKSLNKYLTMLSNDVEAYVKHNTNIADDTFKYFNDSQEFDSEKYLTAATKFPLNSIADLLLTCRLKDAQVNSKVPVVHAFFQEERIDKVGTNTDSNLKYVIENAYNTSYQQEDRLIVFLGMNIPSFAHAICLDIDLYKKKAVIYDSSQDLFIEQQSGIIGLRKYLSELGYQHHTAKHPICIQQSGSCVNVTIEMIVHLLCGTPITNEADILAYHLNLASELKTLKDVIMNAFKTHILDHKYESGPDVFRNIRGEYKVQGGILHFLTAYALSMHPDHKGKIKNQGTLLSLLVKAYSTSSRSYLMCLNMLMTDTEKRLSNGLDCINKMENRGMHSLDEVDIDIDNFQVLIFLAEVYLQKHHYKQAIAFIDRYITIHVRDYPENVDNDAFILKMRCYIGMGEYHSAYTIFLELNLNDLREAHKNKFCTIISKLIKEFTSLSEHEKVMELFEKCQSHIVQNDDIYKIIALMQSSLSLEKKEELITTYNKKATRKVEILTRDNYATQAQGLVNNQDLVNNIYCIKGYRNIVILTTEACMIENIGIPKITQLYYLHECLYGNSIVDKESLVLRLSRKYYECSIGTNIQIQSVIEDELRKIGESLEDECNIGANIQTQPFREDEFSRITESLEDECSVGANIQIQSFIEDEFSRITESLKKALREIRHSICSKDNDAYEALTKHICGVTKSPMNDRIFIKFEYFLDSRKDATAVNSFEKLTDDICIANSYEYVLINYFIALHHASNIINSLDDITNVLLAQHNTSKVTQVTTDDENILLNVLLNEGLVWIGESTNFTNIDEAYIKKLIEESPDDSVAFLKAYFNNMQIVIDSKFPYLKHQAYLCTGKILELIYRSMITRIGNILEPIYESIMTDKDDPFRKQQLLNTNKFRKQQLSSANKLLNNMLRDCSMYFNKAKEIYPNIASSYLYLAILYQHAHTYIAELYIKDSSSITNTICSLDYLKHSILMQFQSVSFLEPGRSDYVIHIRDNNMSAYSKDLVSLKHHEKSNDTSTLSIINSIKVILGTKLSLADFIEVNECNRLFLSSILATIRKLYKKALLYLDDAILINDNFLPESRLLKTYIICMIHSKNGIIEIDNRQKLRKQVEDCISKIDTREVYDLQNMMQDMSHLHFEYKKMLKSFYTIKGNFLRDNINVFDIDDLIINAFLYLYPSKSSFKNKIDYNYSKLGLQGEIYEFLQSARQNLLSIFYLADYKEYITQYKRRIAQSLTTFEAFNQYAKFINSYIHSVCAEHNYTVALATCRELLQNYIAQEQRKVSSLKMLLLFNMCLLSIQCNQNSPNNKVVVDADIAQDYIREYNQARSRSTSVKTRIVGHISHFILHHSSPALLNSSGQNYIYALANTNTIGINDKKNLHIQYCDIEMYLCYLILIKFYHYSVSKASVNDRLQKFVSQFMECGLDINRIGSLSGDVESELRFLLDNILAAQLNNMRYSNYTYYRTILLYIQNNISPNSKDHQTISDILLIDISQTPQGDTPNATPVKISSPQLSFTPVKANKSGKKDQGSTSTTKRTSDVNVLKLLSNESQSPSTSLGSPNPEAAKRARVNSSERQ